MVDVPHSDGTLRWLIRWLMLHTQMVDALHSDGWCSTLWRLMHYTQMVWYTTSKCTVPRHAYKHTRYVGSCRRFSAVRARNLLYLRPKVSSRVQVSPRWGPTSLLLVAHVRTGRPPFRDPKRRWAKGRRSKHLLGRQKPRQFRRAHLRSIEATGVLSTVWDMTTDAKSNPYVKRRKKRKVGWSFDVPKGARENACLFHTFY